MSRRTRPGQQLKNRSGTEGQAGASAVDLGHIGPGLAVAAACGAASQLIGVHVAALSPLVVAVILGALVVNLGRHRSTLEPGAEVVARHVLRIGIVLLGFRLSLSDAAAIGASGLVLVLGVVTVTFLAVLALGRLLGLSPGLTSLTATGYAICGVSAIAAMKGVVDADEEEVSYAMGLVTLCGTLAIVVLPLLAGPLDLEPEAFGAWVGASVHDVGQVIATASTNGTEALEAATVVKLTRVALLGPLVAGMGIARRRAHKPGPGDRVPLVPWFVVAFCAAIVLRTTGHPGTGTRSHPDRRGAALRPRPRRTWHGRPRRTAPCPRQPTTALRTRGLARDRHRLIRRPTDPDTVRSGRASRWVAGRCSRAAAHLGPVITVRVTR